MKAMGAEREERIGKRGVGETVTDPIVLGLLLRDEDWLLPILQRR